MQTSHHDYENDSACRSAHHCHNHQQFVTGNQIHTQTAKYPHSCNGTWCKNNQHWNIQCTQTSCWEPDYLKIYVQVPQKLFVYQWQKNRQKCPLSAIYSSLTQTLPKPHQNRIFNIFAVTYGQKVHTGKTRIELWWYILNCVIKTPILHRVFPRRGFVVPIPS